MLGAQDQWRSTGVYGCAHYGKSLFWYASELLFAFFLTEVGGVPAGQMGLILALGLLASAVIDVGVGTRLSHVLPGAAGAGRLQFVGAGASAASMMLMFACYWLPDSVRLGGVLAASLAFRASYALYDIPQNSLLSLATQGDRARTTVAATRYMFSGLAALTVAATIAPLLGSGSAPERALLFCQIGLGLSAVAIVSAWLLARAVGADRAGLDRAGRAGERPGPLSPDIRLLVGLMFVVSMAGPTFSKMEPYFAAFVLRDPLVGGGVAMAVPAGMALSQPLWGLLALRWSRASLLAAAAAMVVLASALFFLVAGAGTLAVLAGALLFGAGSGGLGMAIWAGFADAVARDGAGRAEWAYALFTASAKASLALSGLAIGLTLGQIDYRGDESELLVRVMVLPSILAGGLCVLIASGWRLSIRRRRPL